MLIRYQDLVSLRMTASDGSPHSIEDVFISDAELKASYVVVDIGGWFSGRKAMISISRFGQPDVGASTWPARIDEAALEEKPEPTPAGDDPASRSLPGAMLGPVGGLVSPRLLYGERVREGDPIPAAIDPREKAPEGGHIRSVGEWIIDTDVLATDGHAGKLMGVIFETDDWRARYLIIGTEAGRLPKNQRVVPVDFIAGIDWIGRSVSLDCPIARVHESPDLHEMDGLAGKWYNRVLAYYGLQG